MIYPSVLAQTRAKSRAQHPSHTWQSWRDRYLKILDKRPEEWKQDFTSKAQVLLGGSNGQGKTATTPIRTKRTRSNEPGDQHSASRIKNRRVNDSSSEDPEEGSASDTNRTGSLQTQVRGNTLPKTPPPIEALRCSSPSSQLIAEQEEAAQNLTFRAQAVPSSQRRDRSSPRNLIDLTNEDLEGSGSDSSDEDDLDFQIPEPEGGFSPETRVRTSPQNQRQTQHSSSHSASLWNHDESLTCNEESERTLVPERALDSADHTQNDDDESDQDEEAAPNFHDLYAYYKKCGYSDADIATAFYATSANPDVLEPVLEGLEAGNGVPQDMKTVWTEDDDKLLRSLEDSWGENVAMKSLVVRKHGLTECEWRMAFLERMRLGSSTLR